MPAPPDSVATGSELAPRKVSFGQAISRFYANYANFKGRASRSEYWFVVLYSFIVQAPLYLLATSTGTTDPFTGVVQPNGSIMFVILIFVIANLIPSLAVAVRRMHDVNKSGAILFLALIPLIGGILLLVFAATEGTPSDNQYGPAS